MLTAIDALADAHWIWWPSQRTLPNTFVLFRHALTIRRGLVAARGWITADSRYRLTLDGQRIQWGPAPCDPRRLDLDPVDLTTLLTAGNHAIGVEVLFYGHGEGTWVAGKPAMMCRFDCTYDDGTTESLVSDRSWLSLLDRSHRPGQYQRWFLRALQEDCDLRLRPTNWDEPGFVSDNKWLEAMELDGPSHMPPAFGSYRDWLTDANFTPNQDVGPIAGVVERTIPLMHEQLHLPARLVDAGTVQWHRDPQDWFESRTPGSFTLTSNSASVQHKDDVWLVQPPSSSVEGVYATFVWDEQMVGWPVCTLDVADGTIVEIITQEAHDPAATHWLDSHYFTWSRFTCHAGINTLEPFDFDSLRWVQLHIHETTEPITIRLIAIRRRSFAWEHAPHIVTDAAPLQRLFDASINTLVNSAQETLVDGMGRERQQYSGDCGHQARAVRALFGETRLPARYIATFSAGQTFDGYFLDCWPGADRLTRVAQRMLGISGWGPILDHSVGFVFDCWHHLLETNQHDAIPYARLVRFAQWLAQQRDGQGLLPVEQLGIPSVWLDHDAYQRQRHKQCAFTLYSAAMYTHALAPLARLFDDGTTAAWCQATGTDLVAAAQTRYWSAEHGAFVANLPWLLEEENIRFDDRSIATSILFDQCPQATPVASLRLLAAAPSALGLSFPPNAWWRYQALAKWGWIDTVLADLRTRWATLPSVIENRSIQEEWLVRPDSAQQWSHCGIVPLNVGWMLLAGIHPTQPGFARYRVRPQLGDLGDIALTTFTPQGKLTFRAIRETTGHRVEIDAPPGGVGTFELIDWDQQRQTVGQALTGEQSPLSPGEQHHFWVPLAGVKPL